MESSSCSICLEDINKCTGQVLLSCQHAFHYRCIDNWFSKQVWEGLDQTCPCCRDGGQHHDRASVRELEEDDEEDEEEEEGEEEENDQEEAADDEANPEEDFEEDDRIIWVRISPGHWAVTSSSTLAYDNVRSLFGPLNELEEQDPVVEAIAKEQDPMAVNITKIQAIIRGHLVRRHNFAR